MWCKQFFSNFNIAREAAEAATPSLRPRFGNLACNHKINNNNHNNNNNNNKPEPPASYSARTRYFSAA